MSAEIAEFPAHVLPADDLRALARGEGGADAVRRFAFTERSWRLIALRHLVSALEGTPATGPLSPIEDALQVLTDAETRDEAAVTDVLMYPQAGIWIAHMLRRLQGVVTDDAPLWVDTGYLHTLAATAAIRAGAQFTLRVPVRSGAVVLPGLGLAWFPGIDGAAAEVRCIGGATEIAVDGHGSPVAVGGAGWRPLPRCHAESGGRRIGFALDDVDPYRDLRGYSVPAPLEPADVARWQSLLDDAWSILAGQDRAVADSVAAAIASLTPLPAAEPYRPLSASCDEAFAAVQASMPDDAEQLAVTLVHETQHVKLGALTHLVSFVRDTGGPLCWAPWRDDPRPLRGLLQGLYAFVGITGYWRHRTGPAAEFEFALWRLQLRRVLSGLAGDDRLSAEGHSLVGGLASTVRSWGAGPVSAPVQRLAELFAADHSGQWRALHIAADEAWVSAAADAWATGEPCPAADGVPVPAPVTDTGARWLDGRAVLARMWLGDPEEFAIVAKAPAAVAGRVPGTLPPDLALISGDVAGARDGYVRHLSHRRDDHRAWVGLGLALGVLGEPAGLLADRPELVRAVARRVDNADPLRLVAWTAVTRVSC
ncbi:HEXXH motif domain-containing protein [Catenuloplanes sp. NPDC051500]|uniref:HEXXH motif domain-containing protein n=1 Tax=Catenuloplanes sp. NPDC051500 TaxID=3363959 RepID=UPI0037BC6951